MQTDNRKKSRGQSESNRLQSTQVFTIGNTDNICIYLLVTGYLLGVKCGKMCPAWSEK